MTYIWEVLIDKIMVISIVLPITVLFVLIVESWGFLMNSVIKKITKDNSPDSPLLHIVLGILPLGMWYFALGASSLLYDWIVLISGLTPLLFVNIWRIIRIRRVLKEGGNQLESKNLTIIQRIFNWIQQHHQTIIGLALSFLIGIVFAFNVGVVFDGVWYHFAIPKLFMQYHDSSYLGEHTRYSVHPFLNFFFVLWVHALPVTVLIKSIVLNVFQLTYLVVAINLGINWIKKTKTLDLPSWFWMVIPTLVAFNVEVLFWLGEGYNDIYGYAIGFAILAWLYRMFTSKQLGSYQISVFIVMLAILSLFKIFFMISAVWIFAAFILFTLVSIFQERFPDITKIFPIMKSTLIAGILTSIFAILPWIIRSYIFTGRPLDPVGRPELNDDVLSSVGALSISDYYARVVWERLMREILPIFLLFYTPILIVSLGSIFAKTKFTILHAINIISWIGFWLTYFSGFAISWRYQLAFIGFMILTGVVHIVDKSMSWHPLSRILIVSTLFIPIALSPFIYETNYARYGYLVSRSSLKVYVHNTYDRVFNYYIEPNYVPDDYSKDTVLFSANVLGIGLIENPVESFDNMSNEEEDAIQQTIHTASDLKVYIQSTGAEYILVDNNNVQGWCRADFSFEDPEECAKVFPLVVVDPYAQISWYKV